MMLSEGRRGVDNVYSLKNGMHSHLYSQVSDLGH